MRLVRVLILVLFCFFTACGGGGGSSGSTGGSSGGMAGGSSTGGETNPVCTVASSSGAVQRPVLVWNIPGQTGWYASPIVSNLGGTGQKIVASYYSIFVYDRSGNLLDRANGNGSIEIVATTTQTQPTSAGGAQVFVFNANGTTYQPTGVSWPAWPRYNNISSPGGDADRNGQGHSGYGCYDLNIGIGNIDDSPDLEIIVTYDNHEIQAFKHDGVAINASSWFTNPSSQYPGMRMTWGQFIRWADPTVELNHYHLHTGTWPNPSR